MASLSTAELAGSEATSSQCDSPMVRRDLRVNRVAASTDLDLPSTQGAAQPQLEAAGTAPDSLDAWWQQDDPEPRTSPVVTLKEFDGEGFHTVVSLRYDMCTGDSLKSLSFSLEGDAAAHDVWRLHKASTALSDASTDCSDGYDTDWTVTAQYEEHGAEGPAATAEGQEASSELAVASPDSFWDRFWSQMTIGACCVSEQSRTWQKPDWPTPPVDASADSETPRLRLM